MSLARFFEHMGPFFEGRRSIEQLREALGPLPSPDADYAFFADLLDYELADILAQMYPPVRALLEAADIAWRPLCRTFLRDHPPRGFSVPRVGEGFADWLAARRVAHPELPEGVEAVADLVWTRFVARTAPETSGLGLDVRLFVRHYPIDASATARAALEGRPLPEPTPTTRLVYRCLARQTVRELSASRATLAVLLAASGAEVPPPLKLADEPFRAERDRLVRHGVMPTPTPAEESR